MEVSVHDDSRVGTKLPPALAPRTYILFPCHTTPVCATVRMPRKLTFTLRLSRTVDKLLARGWYTSCARSLITYATYRWILVCIYDDGEVVVAFVRATWVDFGATHARLAPCTRDFDKKCQ